MESAGKCPTIGLGMTTAPPPPPPFIKVNMLIFLVLSLLDYLMNKKFDIGQELSNKVQCIRFIIGLLEHQQADDCASQESSGTEEQFSEDENESRFLGCDCLNFFDKVVKIYPFSDVEKSHMRSALKLQVCYCIVVPNTQTDLLSVRI